MLLTSIAFAVSAVTLARRKVLTRELAAVEGLARVDVLCIDKTGTITEPHPAFERFEAVDRPRRRRRLCRATQRALRPTPAATPWRSKCWARWRPPRPCATRPSTPSAKICPAPRIGRSKTRWPSRRPASGAPCASPAAAPGCWALLRSWPTACAAGARRGARAEPRDRTGRRGSARPALVPHR